MLELLPKTQLLATELNSYYMKLNITEISISKTMISFIKAYNQILGGIIAKGLNRKGENIWAAIQVIKI